MSDTELDPSGTSDGPKSDEGIKKKQVLIELNRRKRASKCDTTKTRYHLEKLIVENVSGNVQELEHRIETLWGVLEETQRIMDVESQKAVMQESKELEAECEKIIEKAQSVIVKWAPESSVVSPPIEQITTNLVDKADTVVTNSQGSSTTTVAGIGINPSISDDITIQGPQATDNANLNSDESAQQPINEHTESISMANPSPQQNAASSSGNGTTVVNHRLKPLKVPTFDGDKKKFEEFWRLFESLVDKSNEPTSLKMARLRQSLTGIALDSIRGLGVSEPEYNEAKEILNTKFGSQRKQLRAYLDDLERMHPLRAADVKGFASFTDLVRVTVVKLQAEGKVGELGDGTLYSLLVKKLTGHQLEAYTRWMNEHSKERSVLSLRDWLKEEVSIRIEAIEMAHGIESEPERTSRKQYPTKGGGRSN